MGGESQLSHLLTWPKRFLTLWAGLSGVCPHVSGSNCKVSSTETANFSELLKLLQSEWGFMRDLAVGVGFVRGSVHKTICFMIV